MIDTSVFVSALIGPSGPSRQLIRRCLTGEYQLMGTSLFCEYESVIGRKQVLEPCPLTQAEILALLQALMSVSQWVFVYYTWRPNLKDEADNHLIELAIAGRASLIATNNIRDFQNSELRFPHLQILKPEAILKGESSWPH
ncbi:putative toxin-antitoxin system toxin component, PIN family [Leptolyngbya iicbica]|uniref:putative toxin-antitoxin system toxin component, PIN family n=1 Tax=Leptolyngbya iicbica TaxID=3161580 RepID=UPI000AACF643|nr:putative toxin-antitoxin system toxin component, PIN family [Leptolyngbya sp. LK]